jgi:hypothetical protein
MLRYTYIAGLLNMKIVRGSLHVTTTKYVIMRFGLNLLNAAFGSSLIITQLFYIKFHMRFCRHLKHKSLNIYRSEKYS